MILPQDYIIQKFYQYAGFPKYKKIARTYEASCPVCREGRSWGKKKRCYYLIEDNAICCHNCGWYSTPLNWIKQVSGLTYEEIRAELENYDILPLDLMQEQPKQIILQKQQTLPLDSINLFDISQIEYYKGSQVVQDALATIKERRLDTAINKPMSLWLSLTDYTHKNRIVIPFYDSNNNIIFYQSRALYSKDTKPKYLGKINGERSLYNLNSIVSSLDYIFIFEGPIDAFFIQNGTAVAGIQEHSTKNFTLLQEQQIAAYRLYKKIWVLDSQWNDKASYEKTKKLIETGEQVFIWPETVGKRFKDINEMCIELSQDKVEPDFIINNTFTGLKAKLNLSKINR